MLETGIWLRRSARGRGIGSQAMTAVLAEASAAGATAVVADTVSDNLRSRALLRTAGFTLTASQARTAASEPGRLSPGTARSN